VNRTGVRTSGSRRPARIQLWTADRTTTATTRPPTPICAATAPWIPGFNRERRRFAQRIGHRLIQVEPDAPTSRKRSLGSFWTTDDAVFVRGFESVGHLIRDGRRFVERKRSVSQAIG
jgi:hypothetical protein